MSSFTSWGSGSGLELKPEITAPGGNIWSTVMDSSYVEGAGKYDDYTGSYSLMSGTSMATPHMAGLAALVEQYVKSQHPQQDAAASAPKVSSPHDPQVQEVLDRGNAFIAQIRACNDAIPGEEISEKISRMELIVRRIFERAEAHPEVVPDLKKLMDYYLPMTVKLLNAYADMDAQPVQGENIQASKKEIEATLDTLNLAFEKLLDDLFRDSAMDVSSDISVLNTQLAQEGLTEDGLSQVKKQQTL